MLFRKRSHLVFLLLICLGPGCQRPVVDKSESSSESKASEVLTQKPATAPSVANQQLEPSPKSEAENALTWGATLSQNRSASIDPLPATAESSASLLSARLEFEMASVDSFLDLSDVSESEKEKYFRLVERVVNNAHSNNPNQWQTILFDFGLGGSRSDSFSDPLINLMIAKVHYELGNGVLASEYSQAAITGFRRSNYPSRIAIKAHEQLDQCVRNIESQNTQTRMKGFKRCREYANGVIWWLEKDLTANPVELRLVWQSVDKMMMSFKQQGFDGLTLEFARDIARKPEVHPWLRAMIRGRSGLNEALLVGMRDRSNRMESVDRAASYLAKATRLAPAFPEPNLLMMQLASLSDKHETPEFWFKKAIAVQQDYIPAYRLALRQMIENEEVNCEDIIEFGRKAVLTGRYDTVVPLMLFESYQSVNEHKFSPKREKQKSKIIGSQLLLRELNESIGLMASDLNPKSDGEQFVSTAYLQTLQLCIAEQMQEFEQVARLSRELGSELNLSALRQMNVHANPRIIEARGHAILGTYREEAIDLAVLLSGGKTKRMANYERISKLTDKVLASDVAGLERLFFESISEQIRVEREFDSGDRTELRFDPAMSNWIVSNPTLTKRSSGNAVEIDINDGARPTLVSRLEFGVDPNGCNQTIQFDVEQLFDQPGGLETSTPFFVLGDATDELLLYFDFANRSIKIRFASIDGLKPTYSFLEPIRHLRVTCNLGPKLLEVYLNGQLLAFKRIDVFKPSKKIVFGVSPGHGESSFGKFRFSNISLKKWKPGPPADFTASTLVSHYKNATDSDPRNGMHWFCYGMAKHFEEDYRTAIGLYENAIELGAPISIVGLQLGDCYERLGQIEEAIDAYLSAANASPSPRFVTSPDAFNPLGVSPANFAAFRYRWLVLSSGKKSVRDSRRETIAKPMNYGPTWYQMILNAQEQAVKGNFKGALTLLRGAADEVDGAFASEISDRITAFEKGKLTPARSVRSFYLNQSLPLFSF